MTSQELLEKIQAMKIPAKNHASTLVEAYVDKIRKNLGPEIAERHALMEAERIKREAEEAIRAEENWWEFATHTAGKTVLAEAWDLAENVTKLGPLRPATQGHLKRSNPVDPQIRTE